MSLPVLLPVLLAVDEDQDTLEAVGTQLAQRYAREYRVECLGDPEEAVQMLTALARAGEEVALALVGHGVSDTTGGELLERVRLLHPHAKRALLVPPGAWADRPTAAAILDAMAVGRIDYYVPRPASSHDEVFHEAVSSFLLEWATDRRVVPHTVRDPPPFALAPREGGRRMAVTERDREIVRWIGRGGRGRGPPGRVRYWTVPANRNFTSECSARSTVPAVGYRAPIFVSERQRRIWPGRVAAMGALTVTVLIVGMGLATVLGPSSSRSGTEFQVPPLLPPALLAPDPARGAHSSDARPGASEMRDARHFAADRAGTVSFALADGDRVRGSDVDRRFASASLTKAMLLLAYLRQLERDGEHLGEDARSLLEPMIRNSDNAAASHIERLLAPEVLDRLAKRAGMTRFTYTGDWANAQVTAADQARLFLRADQLTPPAHRDYARRLLSGIASEQSWGIPAAARPRWEVFFKGGWRPEAAGELVHQAALLERHDRRLGIAVLSDGNPSHAYGTTTVRGIAARLLGGR